jgi:hypothetical protein
MELATVKKSRCCDLRTLLLLNRRRPRRRVPGPVLRFSVVGLALVPIAMALVLPGCIERKSVQIVLSEEVGVAVHHEEPDASGGIPTPVGFPGFLESILANNGYSREDVVAVHVVGGFFGSSNVEGDHDWVVSGQIQARRTDSVVAGPTVDVMTFESQSVKNAEGKRIVAPLTTAGVELIEQAITDYLAGDSPVLEFDVNNDDVSPSPTVIDTMALDVNAWVTLQIIIEIHADVPDPF